MQRWLKMFAGTCHKCREVGHKACNCRRSVDLPKCSANEVATTTDGQAKTWGHDLCYNLKEKSRKGSRRESVAVERPTNILERVADDLGTDLLRKVSDKEQNLLKVPVGLCEPRDKPQELQSLPVEGESQDSKWQVAEANAMAEGTSGSAEAIGKATVVNGKAWPGSKPAKRASEVDEAEETPDGQL